MLPAANSNGRRSKNGPLLVGSLVLAALLATALAPNQVAGTECTVGLAIGDRMLVWEEKCDFEEGHFDMRCVRHPVVKGDAYFCQDLMREFMPDSCAVKITFELMSNHRNFLPEAWQRRCKDSMDVQLTVKVASNYVAGRYLFDDSLALNVLQIEGGVLVDQARDDSEQIDCAMFEHMVTTHKVRHLILKSIEASGKILLANDLSFRDMHSVTLSDINFKGIQATGINLLNVLEFSMVNVDVGLERLPDGAISWKFAEGNCPRQPATLTLDAVNLDSFNEKSLFMHNSCKGDLRIRIMIRGSSSYVIEHKGLFGQLIEQAGPRTNIEFHFDPIECCQEANNWLFKERNTDLPRATYNVLCHDIGKNISSYTKSERDTTCKNRNVTPIYLIAMIAIGSLAFLILILSAFWIVFVMPRQGANNGQIVSGLSSLPSDLLGSGSGSSDQVIEVKSSAQTRAASPSSNTGAGNATKKRNSRSTSTKRRLLKHKGGGSAAGSKRVNANLVADKQARLASETASVKTEATAAPSKAVGSQFFHTLA